MAGGLGLVRKPPAARGRPRWRRASRCAGIVEDQHDRALALGAPGPRCSTTLRIASARAGAVVARDRRRAAGRGLKPLRIVPARVEATAPRSPGLVSLTKVAQQVGAALVEDALARGTLGERLWWVPRPSTSRRAFEESLGIVGETDRRHGARPYPMRPRADRDGLIRARARSGALTRPSGSAHRRSASMLSARVRGQRHGRLRCACCQVGNGAQRARVASKAASRASVSAASSSAPENPSRRAARDETKACDGPLGSRRARGPRCAAARVRR